MRNTLLTLCLAVSLTAVCLSGCKSSSGDPVERATALLKARNAKVPSFSSMDSVMGYADAFACEMTAANTQYRADSLLQAYRKQGAVREHVKELETYGETAFSLSKGAARYEMEAKMSGKPKEFVGYEVVLADSLSDDMLRVMMNKEMTEVAIQKIRVR